MLQVESQYGEVRYVHGILNGRFTVYILKIVYLFSITPSYMITFDFGLFVTIIFGIIFSLASKGYKNKTDKSLLIFDLFGKKNKVDSQQNNVKILNDAIEMSEKEAL